MGFDAFISYEHSDKAAADETCAALEAAGIKCWIAPRDLRPGVSYGAAIIEAIDTCRVMVLIFSSRSNASDQVQREIERAVSKHVPLLPMRVEAVSPTRSMEYFLGSIQWLDAFTPPLSQHFPELVAAIKGTSSTTAVSVQTLPERSAAPVAAPEMTRWKVRPAVAYVVAVLLLVSLAQTMWGNFNTIVARFHRADFKSTARYEPSLASVCQGPGSLWSLDNSLVFLQAVPDDSARVIYYCQGPQAGRVLFSGRRSTNQYIGTAYVYSNKCGSFSYDASGQILNDDNTVIITGAQPQIDESICKVNGFHDIRVEMSFRN